MERTPRVFLSPIAGIVTMAIGVGCVLGIEMVTSLFAASATAVRQEQQREENIGVASTENFKSFLPERKTEGLVLSCYDPTILPVWKELKKDEGFNDRLDGATGVMNCSDMLDVRKVDLNDDGTEEFLARGKASPLCGATGNCGLWIFDSNV